VVQVNTNLLPDPATWPTSWKDFANPRPEWKGNLIGSIPRERSSAFQVYACLLENFGEETTKAIWKGIMSCDPMLFNSGTACNEALLRGEGAIHYTVVPAYWFQEDKGYPVKTLFFADGIVRYMGKISVLASAPHPNAARLFTDWFLSVEGQTVQNQVGGYYSANPKVKHLKELPECVNLRFDEAAAGMNRNALLDMWDQWMAEGQ
ncbi:MAG: ABC transporter substrate-binding protein, partial [Bacillota bacterium]